MIAAHEAIIRTVRPSCVEAGIKTVLRALPLLLPCVVAASAHVQQQPAELKPGVALERKIVGGETHSYTLVLSSGQFLRAVANQRGADVAVKLLGPGGQPIAEASRVNATVGQERIQIVAEAAGDYGLEVRAREQDAIAGQYELLIEEAREAGPLDKARAAGERLLIEADWLAAQRTAESLPVSRSKCEESLKLFRVAGDRQGQADALVRLGQICTSSHESDRALEYYAEAINIRRELGDRQQEAYVCLYIGSTYLSLAEKQKSLDYFNQGLDLSRAVGDQSGEAALLNLMGSAYASLGESQKALYCHGQSLTISRALGGRRGQAMALNNLALTYSNLGNDQKSLDYYGRALALWRAMSERLGEARTLHNICEVYLSAGDNQKALEYCELALPIHRAVNDRGGEAHTLNHIGDAYFSFGQHQQALEYQNRALALWRSTRGRHNEANTLERLGTIQLSLGQHRQAMSFYEQSLKLAREVGNHGAEASALAGMARVERDRNNLAEARANIEAAINVVESLRAKVASQDLRASYFASRRNHYESYLDILLRQHQQQPSAGHNAAALEASERARARSLLELLAEAEANVQQGIDPALKQRERDAQSLMSSIQGRLIQARLKATPDKSEIAALESELERVEEGREQLEQEIRQKHPKYAELRYPTPLRLEAIQSLLDGETSLLEYTLGSEGSFLFVVTRDAIESHRLPAASEIARLVQELRAASSRPGRRAFARYARAARQLYQLLISPAAGALANKRNLLVAPDGALHYLPFECLLSGEVRAQKAGYKDLDYLLKRWSISYVPSASVLASLRQNQMKSESRASAIASKKFVAFGDPVYETAKKGGEAIERGLVDDGERWTLERLGGSGRELTLIANLYKPEEVAVYLRGSATEENVKTNEHLSRARRIHFATHGLINEQQPQHSGLLLTLDAGAKEDGLLQAHEIFNLKLNADLVVLSACETGLGKEMRGEGVIGLARAFMYAGTPSVVVSLWKVADRSTADLMISFYRQLDGKLDKAESLRRAKLGMIRGGRYAHPYYWASFVLIGDPSGL